MDHQLKHIKACGISPNCVSSINKGFVHKVAPFPIQGAAENCMQILRDLLNEESRVTIKNSDAEYIAAEFTTSVMKFVDDVEFELASDCIHVRSASRVGFSDMGTNRKRIESLRKAYLKRL